MKALAPLAALLLTALLACACDSLQGVRIERDLEYVPGGGPSRSLDVYLPEDAKGPLPVLVYIHGGGWGSGDKRYVNGDVLSLTRLGYAVVSLNYRFSREAPFPAQIEDCKAAIRWLRANAKSYGFDPARIGATGESAGGHLSALLATCGATRDFDKGPNLDQRSDIKAALIYCAPCDLRPSVFKEQLGGKTFLPGGRECLVSLFGGEEGIEEKAKAASPALLAGPDAAPLYIIHGKADALVPYRQSVLLVEACERNGTKAVLFLDETAGHEIPPSCRSGEGAKAILKFLDENLKGATPGKGG